MPRNAATICSTHAPRRTLCGVRSALEEGSHHLGVGVESVAPRRSGLIAKGRIHNPVHGDTAFTVPLFDEFLTGHSDAVPADEPTALDTTDAARHHER